MLIQGATQPRKVAELELNLSIPLQCTCTIQEILIPPVTEHEDYGITGSLMDSNLLFGRSYCLHLQGGSSFSRNFGIYIPKYKNRHSNSSNVGTTAVYRELWTFQNINLVHNSFNLQQYICYTTLLNMFRAARCSSSGGPNVSPQPLVSSPSVSSRTVFCISCK